MRKDKSKTTVKSVRHKKEIGERVFDVVVYGMLVIFALLAAYPLIYVLSASVSDPVAVNSGNVWLWPVGFNLKGYKEIFENSWVLIGYRNSLFYAVVGTTLNVIVTLLAGFALSRKDLYGRRVITFFVLFPMWFSGGIISTYLVVQGLELDNKWYTLLILGLVSVYNIIITRSFISESIPDELLEAARIDGCSDFGIFTKIVTPLSKPVIAILCLYYGLGHWNGYFNALIYMKDKNLMPLQIFLREILAENQSINMEIQNLEAVVERALRAQTMKYGLIVVASLPMLMIYPFLQKFFVKGIMIGSVKG